MGTSDEPEQKAEALVSLGSFKIFPNSFECVRYFSSAAVLKIHSAIIKASSTGRHTGQSLRRRREEGMEGKDEQKKKKKSKGPEIFFPLPLTLTFFFSSPAAVTSSASLNHITLRRSSQRLAGGAVWPGWPWRRWAEGLPPPDTSSPHTHTDAPPPSLPPAAGAAASDRSSSQKSHFPEHPAQNR